MKEGGGGIRGGEEHTCTHTHKHTHASTHTSTQRETKNIKRQSEAQGTEHRLQRGVQTPRQKMEVQICSVTGGEQN